MNALTTVTIYADSMEHSFSNWPGKCFLERFNFLRVVFTTVIHLCNHISLISLQVIEETLSPTWNEVLIFEQVTIYGKRTDFKDKPPFICVEFFDIDIGVSTKPFTALLLSHFHNLQNHQAESTVECLV